MVLRRFFGGEGIYSGEVMIGAIFDDRIFFKTDENSRKKYLAERTKPFTFKKHSTGEWVETTWYAIPDRLYDEPEEFAQWAKAAFDTAMASAIGKPKSSQSRKKRSR